MHVCDNFLSREDAERLFRLVQDLTPTPDPWGYWMPLRSGSSIAAAAAAAASAGAAAMECSTAKRARMDGAAQPALRRPPLAAPSFERIRIGLAQAETPPFEGEAALEGIESDTLNATLCATLRRIAEAGSATVGDELETGTSAGVEWWWRLHPAGSLYSSVQLHVDRDEGLMLQSQSQSQSQAHAQPQLQRQGKLVARSCSPTINAKHAAGTKCQHRREDSEEDAHNMLQGGGGQ